MASVDDRRTLKSGTSRLQIRVQEFAKKFRPQVLRSQFRAFRSLVQSVSQDRKRPTTPVTSVDHGRTSMNSEVLPVTDSEHDCNESGRKISMNSEVLPVTDPEQNCNESVVADSKMDRNVPSLVIDEVYEPTERPESESNCSRLTIEQEIPRNKSPVTVQEWIDSLPLVSQTSKDECFVNGSNSIPSIEVDSDNLTLGAEAGLECKNEDPITCANTSVTNSCHEPSEVGSHCSSVDSLLEARKPDPEEVLLSLGFGGSVSSACFENGRIPQRFLRPSQLKGVDLEEFIRHQQDLVYTFESGFYGYRGLAGPSHSNPSVIVAKILEKLREHERETASMNSFPLDLKKRGSQDKKVEPVNPNKFSKAARNVLTKIRCTPGSVLTPDNRRWLDSQGKKSPEVARRLILGQQSFTFGQDGDLIESTSPEISNDKQETDHAEDGVNTENLVGEIEKEVEKQDESSVEDSCQKKVNAENEPRLQCRLEDISADSGRGATVDDDGSSDAEKISVSCTNTSEVASTSEVFPQDSAVVWQPKTTDSSHPLSLRDELRRSAEDTLDSGCHDVAEDASSCLDETSGDHEVVDSSLKRLRNILRRYSSFDEETRDEPAEDGRIEPDRGDDYTDSATESEFAAYVPPSYSYISKTIRRQYEELVTLESKLEKFGRPLRIVSEDQFASISEEQRSALQFRIIREALTVYLKQLTEDEVHLELKNCLSTEARKVADLLDNSSDITKLSIIVRQMTLLLQHQSQLSNQIKELSAVEQKPPISCHEMCDHILKRIQDLESLVQQNAQELAQMKFQLRRKNSTH